MYFDTSSYLTYNISFFSHHGSDIIRESLNILLLKPILKYFQNNTAFLTYISQVHIILMLCSIKMYFIM